MSQDFRLKFAGQAPAHAHGPANVYCIGRNYAEHAKELGNEIPTEPVVFLKAASALRDLDGGELAFASETFHHEAEIVLLIGKPVALGAAAGWDCVAALALGIDLTRREVQTALKTKGLPWTAAKSFAGAGLVGAFVDKARFPDLDKILFSFDVNGERRQTGDSSLMLNPVARILTHLAVAQRLVPGDLVYTGTPAGVGPLRRGDAFELAFTQLGESFRGRL